MLPNTYLAPATQILCEICGEVVTTPLCPVCLTGEIEAWTTLYPNLRKDLLPKLKRYLKNLDNEGISSTGCIKCNNERTSLCPYCFSDFALGALKKVSPNPQIIREFIEFFDFDNEPPNPHKAKWGKYPTELHHYH